MEIFLFENLNLFFIFFQFLIFFLENILRVFKLYDEKLEVVKDIKDRKNRLLVIQFDDSSQYKKFRDHFSLKIKDEVIKCHKIGDYRVLKKFLKGFQESKERQDELSCASSDSDEEEEVYIQKFHAKARGENYFQVYQKLFGIKIKARERTFSEDKKTEKNELLDDILNNWEKDIMQSPESGNSKAGASSTKNLSIEFDFLKNNKDKETGSIGFDQIDSSEEIRLRNDEKLKLVKKPSNHSTGYFQDHFQHQASNQPHLDIMKESYKNYLPVDRNEVKRPVKTTPNIPVSKNLQPASRVAARAVNTKLFRRVKPRNFTEDQIQQMSETSIRKLLEYQKSIFELKQRLIEEKYEKVKEKIALKIKVREEKEKKVQEKKKKPIKKPVNNKKRRKQRAKKNNDFSEYVKVRR